MKKLTPPQQAAPFSSPPGSASGFRGWQWPPLPGSQALGIREAGGGVGSAAF